jgi:uncharacterized protein YciI
MLYSVMGHDVPDSLAKRKEARPAHVERLKQLQAQGRLILAGPRPAIDAADPGAAGFIGSLIVAEFDDLAAARAWADADPYMKAGVYSHIDVQPFIKTMP